MQKGISIPIIEITIGYSSLNLKVRFTVSTRKPNTNAKGKAMSTLIGKFSSSSRLNFWLIFFEIKAETCN